MEVAYLGIQKSDREKRKFVYVISHSRWNDGFDLASSLWETLREFCSRFTEFGFGGLSSAKPVLSRRGIGLAELGPPWVQPWAKALDS